VARATWKAEAVRRPSRVSRSSCLVALAASVLLALTACGGGGPKSPSLTPTKAVALAKANLDKTPGLHLALSGKDLPDSSALVSADGTLTRAPAFNGKLVVSLLGTHPTIPVIATGGTVYAQLPLTTGWKTLDPAKYGIPDPSALLDPQTGISHLLTATRGLKAGTSVRGGKDNKEVLTTYTGTLPGTAVAAVIPSASGTFDVRYTIDDSHRLEQAAITGDFYGGDAKASTYTLTLDQYGLDPKIPAP
jgi:lipoprotein LprG